jgi:hypothetical protein
VRELPDATIAELRRFDSHGVRVGMGLMWNTLDRLGLTFKKRMARPVCKRFLRHGSEKQSATTYPACRQ